MTPRCVRGSPFGLFPCDMPMPCNYHDPLPSSVVLTRSMRLAVAHEEALADAVKGAAAAARARVLSELSLDDGRVRRAAWRARAEAAERKGSRRARRIAGLLMRARLTEHRRWPLRWVRLPQPILSDVPCLLVGGADAGIYPAWGNRHGALWIKTPDGELGIRPSEYVDLGRWGDPETTCARGGCWAWVGTERDVPSRDGGEPVTRITVGLACPSCHRRTCLACMDPDVERWLRCVDCAARAREGAAACKPS